MCRHPEPTWELWRPWGALGFVELVCWISSSCRWSKSSFEFDGCKHAKRRVSALAIVKDFEVFENCGGELDAGVPTLAVEEFYLHPTPKRFHLSVVIASPTEPMDGRTPAFSQRWPNANEVYWLPWSE